MKSPYKQKLCPKINDKIDDLGKNAFHQKIHRFWFRREIPTLKKILQNLKDDITLPDITRTSLQRILKELNIEYTKRNQNSALIKRGDLVL